MQFLLHLARGFKPCKLSFRHTPLLEPFGSRAQERGRTFGDSRYGASRDTLLVLFRDEILALRRREVRAVDGEQRLPFAELLIGRVGKDFLDVSRIPHLDVSDFGFIDGDIARCPNLISDHLVFDPAHANADALHAFG